MSKHSKVRNKPQPAAPANTGKPGTLRRHILFSAALALITFLLYSNSLHGEFICDDEFLVRDNLYIRSVQNIPRLFTQNIAAGGGEQWSSYRPLQMITYMMDYRLWKLNPRGYHLTNILIQACAVIALYWLLLFLLMEPLTCFIAAVLFALHPIHTGAVAFISGRADPLALLLMALTFIFYLRMDNPARACGLIALSFSAALLSRENAMVLPLLLLVYHFAFRKPVRRIPFALIAGLSVLYGLIRTTLLRDMLANVTFHSSALQRVPGFFAAFAGYLRLLVFPHPLSARYGNTLFAWTHPQVLVGLALFLVFCALLWQQRRSRGPLFFGLAWFLVSLIPLSNIAPPLNAFMAEHWLYVPSIGICFLAGRFLLHGLRRWNFMTGIVIAIIIAGFFTKTMARNRAWLEPIGFYRETLEHTPDKFQTLYNLGVAQAERGLADGAMESYRKALEINPAFPAPYNNLAYIYLSRNKPDSAVPLLEKALALEPNNAEACNNLGGLLYMSGRRGEALEWFRKAVAIRPSFAEAQCNLGISLMVAGHPDSAAPHFQMAIAADPDFEKAWFNLGVLLANADRLAEARKCLVHALDLNPSNTRAVDLLRGIESRQDAGTPQQ